MSPKAKSNPARLVVMAVVAVVVLGLSVQQLGNTLGWFKPAAPQAPVMQSAMPDPMASGMLPSAPVNANPVADIPDVLLDPESEQGPRPLPPPEAGLSPEQLELSNLRQQIHKAEATLGLLEVQSSIASLSGDVQGAQSGRDQLPVLVGLTGSGDTLYAEFAVGTRVFTARRGEMVTADWRLVEVHANAVTVVKNDGSARHTMLLGGEVPGSAGAQRRGMPQQAPMPLAPQRM